MHKLIIAMAAIIIFGGILALLHLLGRNKERKNQYTRSKKKPTYQTPKEPYLENQIPLKKETVSMPDVESQKTALEVFIAGSDSDDADEVLGLKKSTSAKELSSVEKNITPKNDKSPQANHRAKIIILHLMAPKEQPYAGYELLQSLLSNGLRYGKMNIFHRHEHKTGRGPVIFSLASAQEPGTFELPKMGGFTCPGLTLFFMLNHVDDPLKVFDVMLETVGSLLDDLGGRVLDEQFEPLTKEKVVLTRKKIREQLETQQIPDLFEEVH